MTDALTNELMDGISDSNTATTTITITFVNDPPVADNQSVAVAEDSSNNKITILFSFLAFFFE